MHLRKIIVCLFLTFFLINFSFVIAQFNENTQDFNINNANKRLSAINAKLSIQDLKSDNLEALFSELTNLQNQAKKCVDTTQEQLNSINELLKSNQMSQPTQRLKKAYESLRHKRDIYAGRLSECRLFVFHSQETLVTLTETIQRLSKFELLERGTSIWKIFDRRVSFKEIDFEKMYKLSGIELLSSTQWVVLFLLLALGTGIAFLIKRLCVYWVDKIQRRYVIFASIVWTIKTFVIPIFIFLITSLFFTIFFTSVTPIPTIALISHAILFYILVIFILHLLFYSKPPTTSFFRLSPRLGKTFYLRLSVIALWLLLGYIAIALFREQQLSVQLIGVVRAFYITLISLSVVWLCWLSSKLPIVKKVGKGLSWFIKLTVSILLLIMIVPEWMGYHRLAVFMIVGIFYTLLLIGIVWIITRFVGETIHILHDNKYYAARWLRYYLGLKPHRTIIELYILKFALYIIIACMFALILLKMWNVSTVYVDGLKHSFIEGFTVAGLKVIPARIIAAIVIFGVLNIITRVIASYVARHQQFEGEKDTQVAVASIIIYIGFAVALLIALIVAGVNFTGLAIVAGALSVGIGLGLQSIVNNFVSGVILLLEKPIKPGDRIIVDGTEGFVKKIRVRSTQITTMTKEDVIVPNSNLITSPVTNYMFRDKLWRVTCRVGVAYGSDVELVKKILITIAKQHTDILQESPNNIRVLFREFGDSALIFELWCIIRDVNKKYMIMSELNFSINKAFSEHNIVIAFPQRDIHVKDWSLPSTR